MAKPSLDAPGVIIFPPFLWLITVGVGVAAHYLAPVPLTPAGGWRLAGTALVLAAGGNALWARAQMVRAGTNVNPGKPATAIVTGGPYRFTRNPMYLSLCTLNLGIGLWMRDLTPVALTLAFAAVLQFGVIKREERYLEAKFGEVYTNYRRRVRRWL